MYQLHTITHFAEVLTKSKINNFLRTLSDILTGDKHLEPAYAVKLTTAESHKAIKDVYDTYTDHDRLDFLVRAAAT